MSDLTLASTATAVNCARLFVDHTLRRYQHVTTALRGTIVTRLDGVLWNDD